MSDFHESREQKLREMAYRLWDAAGRPIGREDEFWQLAEERLDRDQPSVLNDDLDMAGDHSYPASDPVNHT
jgi:Protein of unknown function (DUF2934)